MGLNFDYRDAGEVLGWVSRVMPLYGCINKVSPSKRGLIRPCSHDEHEVASINHTSIHRETGCKSLSVNAETVPVGHVSPAKEIDYFYPLDFMANGIAVHHNASFYYAHQQFADLSRPRAIHGD